MAFSGALNLSVAACQQQDVISPPLAAAPRRTLRSSGAQQSTENPPTASDRRLHAISEAKVEKPKHTVPEPGSLYQITPQGRGGGDNKPPPLVGLSHHPKSGYDDGMLLLLPPPLAKSKRATIRQKKAIENILQGDAERPCTRARCCHSSRPNTRRWSRASSEHQGAPCRCRLFVLRFDTQKKRPPTRRRRHDSHSSIILSNVKKREFPTSAKNMSKLSSSTNGPVESADSAGVERNPSDYSEDVQRPAVTLEKKETNHDGEIKRRGRGRPRKVPRSTGGGGGIGGEKSKPVPRRGGTGGEESKQVPRSRGGGGGIGGVPRSRGGGEEQQQCTPVVDEPTCRPCEPGTSPQHHHADLVLSGAQLVRSFPTGFTNIISVHPKPMWVAASERPVRRSVKKPCCGLCGVCIYLPYPSKLWAVSKSPEHLKHNPNKMHSESNNGDKKIIVWLRTYPKVTLCDMSKRFDVQQDCGYILPTTLKTKDVRCFQRDLKPGVLLKPSRSDKCGNKSSTGAAKCRKRSSSNHHKQTDPQIKGQYTAVDPACRSLETGKVELEPPANCSASLSLGKMETAAGCALLAEERQAERRAECAYKTSHISFSDEETDSASEQCPEFTAPSNSDLSDLCKSSRISSSPDRQENREDSHRENILPKISKCLDPLPNSDDVTLDSGKECSSLNIDNACEAGCALTAEKRKAESDLIVEESQAVKKIKLLNGGTNGILPSRPDLERGFANEQVMLDTVARQEMESVMSVVSQSCLDSGIGCSDTSDTPVEKYREQVDNSCLNYELKESDVSQGPQRHGDPEAGCALIAEERQAESDLLVAEQVTLDTAGREEMESVDSHSCLDSGIGCSDTSDTPVKKSRDQVSQGSSQMCSQNGGGAHLSDDDDDDTEQPELFSCQRARVYFKRTNCSCARTYIRWPFPKSRDPAPEIPAAIETLPAGEDMLITSQQLCHPGKDGEGDEGVPNRREDEGEHTSVEGDLESGTSQFPHSLGTLEPLANAPSGMAILSSPSHVRETASHLYTRSPIPHHALLANSTYSTLTADTPAIVYSSDLLFHNEENVTTSSSQPSESSAPPNFDFPHAYRSSHILSSEEETDTASEHSPQSTAPSNTDTSDSCKSSLISSPDQQENREDVRKESVLPKMSKCLSPLPNSDDLTLASGKECSLLNDTTEQVSVHPLACSAADGDEGNSTVNGRQDNEKLSCSDGESTQSSDDTMTSPSKTTSLSEDEPEVETAEGSTANHLDELTAYENDILLVDVTLDDPDLFGNLPKESLLKLGPTRNRVLGKLSSGTAKQSSSLVKIEMSSIRFDPRLRGQIAEEDDRKRCWKTLGSRTRPLTQGSSCFPTEDRNQAMDTDILDDNNNFLEEEDAERYPLANLSLRETAPVRAFQSLTEMVWFQKSHYCRLYFSENRCCPYKICRFRHVADYGDEKFCFEAMKSFINSQNPKCLHKAGAVFTSYYNSNPMGDHFSMPVLMSLLQALLKAGSVSDIIPVIVISLARNVVPDQEFLQFLQALLNFVREKGLNAFVPQLTQLISKLQMVNAGVQNLDCTELARIMPTPVAQDLTHAIMEVELCTQQEDWKQLGVVFKSLCQYSQVTSELEHISGRIAIALLSETKDKLAQPFVTFAETACQDESDDGVIKIFVGRIGVSLMFRYHKTHQWAQGKRVVEVLSRLQVKYSMLKGLFGNEDGASRCYLVTIATELFLLSDSVEGALKILRDNEWFLSSSSWPCEPCDLEKRSHVLMRLAEKASYREALDIFSNLPGLREPIDHIDASQYGPLLNSHLQVCVNKQALIVAADTALFMFSKNLGIEADLLQMLLIKLGKRNRWDQARKIFKASLSVGYYPDVSAPLGLRQLTVPCSLEEAELALVFEMFITVNATAILNLEDPTPVLKITLKRTHQCEKEYVSAGNRVYSAAGIPFPKLKLTLHRTEAVGSQEQVFLLDTLKARYWLRQNLWAKDFWTHSS